MDFDFLLKNMTASLNKLTDDGGSSDWPTVI